MLKAEYIFYINISLNFKNNSVYHWTFGQQFVIRINSECKYHWLWNPARFVCCL